MLKPTPPLESTPAMNNSAGYSALCMPDLFSDSSAYAEIARLSQAAALLRVRLWGDTTVYKVTRTTLYKTALAVIRNALRAILPNGTDIMLVDPHDMTVITKTSWPLLCLSLYEVVVKVHQPAQAAFPAEDTEHPIVAHGDIIDLTEDPADDIAPTVQRRIPARVSRVPSPAAIVDANEGEDTENDARLITRNVSPSAHGRPVVRIRGASILPHVRKQAKAVRRSLSRSVPVIKPPAAFGAFPTLEQHYKLEKRYKAKRHWVVPPKDKHSFAYDWLSGSRSGYGLDSKDRTWLGRHRVRKTATDDRKFVDEGRELYNLLVRAHGKNHICADRTWRRVRERYVGPSSGFIKMWVQKCPTCRKRG